MSDGPPPEGAVRGWIADAVRTARDAAAAVSEASVRVAAGGIGVDVHLVGADLADALTPALLPAAPSSAPVVAELWSVDATAPGAPRAPRLPWVRADYLACDEVRGCTEGRLLASCTIPHPTLNAIDLDAAIGVQWLRHGVAPWDSGVPLRDLLRWTFGAQGLDLVHAAAVGTDAGGALLCGAGGAGKSTTSLACLRAGLEFVADDYCLIDGDLRAHPLFAVAKADAATLRLLPGLAERTGHVDWRGKAHLGVADVIAAPLALRALVFPQRADRTGAAQPIGPRTALSLLMASTMMQLPAANAATVRVLARLTRTLPAFSLPVGPDVARIPDAVRATIDACVPVVA